MTGPDQQSRTLLAQANVVTAQSGHCSLLEPMMADDEAQGQHRVLQCQQALLDSILKLNQHLLFFREMVEQQIADSQSTLNSSSAPGLNRDGH